MSRESFLSNSYFIVFVNHFLEVSIGHLASEVPWRFQYLSQSNYDHITLTSLGLSFNDFFKSLHFD